MSLILKYKFSESKRQPEPNLLYDGLVLILNVKATDWKTPTLCGYFRYRGGVAQYHMSSPCLHLHPPALPTIS